MSKFMLVSGALATTMAASDSFVPIYDVASRLPEALISDEVAVDTADAFARRLDMNQLQDVVDLALNDVGDAREQFLVTVAEFKAFSPSELLADLAREALQNRDEEPPRNFRERLARRARDAVIESAISTLESVGKKQEAVVRDFLEDSVQETQEFVTEEAQQWKDFFDTNAAEAAEFFEMFATVEEFEDNPWLAIESWPENAGELKDFLGENAEEAGDFFMEQVGDAVEFVTDTTDSALDFVDSQVKFILVSVDRIVDIAEQFGIEHPALDTLKEFSNDPQRFVADAAREFLDEKLIDPLTPKARDGRSDGKPDSKRRLQKEIENKQAEKRIDDGGIQAPIPADLERHLRLRAIFNRVRGETGGPLEVTIDPSFL